MKPRLFLPTTMAAWVLLAPLPGAAAPGTVDPGFRAALSVQAWPPVRALAADAEGRLWWARGDQVGRLLAHGGADIGVTPISVSGGTVDDLATVPGGGVCLVGDFTSVGGVERAGVARLRPDGTLDEGYRTPNLTPGHPRAVAVDRVGRVVVAGDFTQADGVVVPGVARFSATGELDRDFATRLGVPAADALNFAWRVEVLANGNIRMGGSQVVEWNDAGDRVATFGDGWSPGNPIRVRHWMSWGGGTVVMVDSELPIRGEPNVRLRRYNADGSRDASWEIWLTADGRVLGGELDAEGRVVLAGDFTVVNGFRHGRVVRLLPNGSVDPTFAASIGSDWVPQEPQASREPVERVWLQGDGTILATGTFSNAGAIPVPGLVRLVGGAGTSAGPVVEAGPAEVRVREGGLARLGFLVRSAEPVAAAWTRNGQRVSDVFEPVLEIRGVRRGQAGDYRLEVGTSAGTARSEPVRLVVDPAPFSPGSLDPTFQPDVPVMRVDGFATESGLSAVLAAGEAVYLAGGFNTVAAHPVEGVARLLADGRVDRSFVPLRDHAERATLGRPELQWVFANGDVLVRTFRREPMPASMLGTSRYWRLDGTGRQVAGFASIRVEGPGASVVTGAAEGAFYLAGPLEDSPGGAAVVVKRYRSDGTPDTGFATWGVSDGGVVSMVPGPGNGVVALLTRILGDGRRQTALERLDGTGRRDPLLTSTGPWPADARILGQDARGRLYLGRKWTPAPDDGSPRLVRLLPDGSVDGAFRAALAAGEGVDALVPLEEGGVVVAVGPTSRPDGRLTEVIRLQDDGARDDAWQFEPRFNRYPAIASMALGPGGRLLLAGAGGAWMAVFPRDDRRMESAGVASGRFRAGYWTRLGWSYAVERSVGGAAGPWERVTSRAGDGTRATWSEALDAVAAFRLRVEDAP